MANLDCKFFSTYICCTTCSIGGAVSFDALLISMSVCSFHTGDLGRLPADGFVKVTGRLKEQYKLENGKYVCPSPIEETVSLSRFVMQVVLCGANRPHNVALIVPDWAAIRSTLNVDESVSDDDLVNDERVKTLVQEDIGAQCEKLKKFEVPQDIAFVAPFTAANNMLTPKMSVRKHNVVQTYNDVIGSLYGDEPVVDNSSDEVKHEAA